MSRKRWIYTEGGKPLPNGPIEVEVEGSSAVHVFSARDGDGHNSKPQPKAKPDSGMWVDYDGGEK